MTKEVLELHLVHPFVTPKSMHQFAN